MGKEKKIQSIKEFDFTENKIISFISVYYQDNTEESYLIFDNAKVFSNVLAESIYLKKDIKTIHGKISFNFFNPFDASILKELKPLNLEQSNSSFLISGKFFLKIFRKMERGCHPEEEILNELNFKNIDFVPKLLCSIHYTNEKSEQYMLGFLENHIENSQTGWDYFAHKEDIELAFLLGKKTAFLHKALRDLKGCKISDESPPLKKLKHILENKKERSESEVSVLNQIPLLENLIQSYKISHNISLQRIHGDFHLGQILISKNKDKKNNIFIIDFEGEPLKPLEFRRALRSPLVDVAGMLRSFDYLEKTSHRSTKKEQEAFLKSYSKSIQIPLDIIKKEIQPFLINKAIYEVLYELKFRPDWFNIPAEALINFANPGK